MHVDSLPELWFSPSPAGEAGMRFLVIAAIVLIAGCNAGVPPGTGPVAVQQFTVVNTDAPPVFCRGAYERYYGAVTTSAAVLCDDGRTGQLQLNTFENGLPISGIVRLSDGARSSVAFLPNQTDNHAYGRAPSLHRAPQQAAKPYHATDRRRR